MKQVAKNNIDNPGLHRKPYIKPVVQRVDLALEETLSSGCKLAGTVCTDPFPGVSDSGS